MAPRDGLTLDEYDIERPIGDVHNFYRNYVAAIECKEEQYIKNCEVRRVLRVMEECFASDAARQTIEVEI